MCRSHMRPARRTGPLLLLLVSLTLIPLAGRADTELGVVTKGAFLLGLSATQPCGLRKCHALVGYLPVGTLVFLGKERELFNYDLGVRETYREVVSDIGLSGLLRDDLKVDVEGRYIIVAVANKVLQVHQLTATLKTLKDRGQRRSSFSRSSGGYLEVLGEAEDPHFYRVALSWASKTINGNKVRDEGLFYKEYIDIGWAKLVEPERARPGTLHFRRVDDQPGQGGGLGGIGGYILDKGWAAAIATIAKVTGKTYEEARAYFESMLRAGCRLRLNAKGKLGTSLFGTGLGVEASLNLKEPGHVYEAEAYELVANDEVRRVYAGFREKSCKSHRPYRMESFVFQLNDFREENTIFIRLDELPRPLQKSWSITGEDVRISSRMVRVDGYAAYSQLLSALERMTSNSGYLSRRAPEENKVYLNFLLSQIAWFSKPHSVSPANP